MSKMIAVAGLRTALGFDGMQNMLEWIENRGLISKKRGRSQYEPTHLPENIIPTLIFEREHYIRVNNPWRQQKEYDEMWQAAKALGIEFNSLLAQFGEEISKKVVGRTVTAYEKRPEPAYKRLFEKGREAEQFVSVKDLAEILGINPNSLATVLETLEPHIEDSRGKLVRIGGQFPAKSNM